MTQCACVRVRLVAAAAANNLVDNEANLWRLSESRGNKRGNPPFNLRRQKMKCIDINRLSNFSHHATSEMLNIHFDLSPHLLTCI